MRRLLAVLMTLAGLALLGAGGWGLVKVQQRQRATLARLAETQASLAKHQETMTLIEDERRKLADAYETLRGRWSASDEELGRLKQATGRMTKELADAAGQHVSMVKDLASSRQALGDMSAKVDALQQAFAATEAKKAQLETQLQEAAAASLTPAEAEQIGRALAKNQDEQERLRAQLVELSRAYEALAVPGTPALPATEPGAPRSARGGEGVPARDGAPAIRPSPQAEAKAAVAQAQRYRLLGEAYQASHRYAEAADAFEQSLTYVDDPAVHTQLAFLYGRLLSDPEKALLHRAKAPSRVDPAEESLRTTAGAQGLPRSSRKLLWGWLTK